MKKSDIEKKLKSDLSSAAPSDFQSLWNRCETCGVPTPAEECAPELVPAAAGGSLGGRIPRGKGGRRALAWILIAAILLSCALFSLFSGLWGLFKGPGVLPGSDGYFIFDINPSVEISYDKKGRVKDAQGLNEDGEVLLYGVDLAGKSYDEAAEILFERCVKLGYFSAARADNAVLVSATLSEGGKDETMTEEMKKLLSDAFASSRIRGVVITGVDNPALGEQAAAYGIDAQKYELILLYQSLGGELAESRYSSVTVRELYAGISELQKKQKKAEIAELKAEASEAERELFETLSETVQDLIEELEECIERLYEDTEDEEDEARQEAYEERIEELEKYAEEIEDAKNKGEVQSLVNKLSALIKEMSREEPDETLKALLDAVYAQIETLYRGLEDMLKELKHLSATPEETSSARLEKYGAAGGGDEDFDIEKWQEEKEEEFASSWYEFKKQWDAEREHDLDDDDD